MTRCLVKYALLILLILATAIPGASRRIRTNNSSGRKVNTTQSRNKNTKSRNKAANPTLPSNAEEIQINGEELELYRPLIGFSGYDKAASSTKESLCITNDSEETIRAIEIEITYLDMQGRMLHKRTVSIPLIIPPGETRTAVFPHYDPQKSLYFHRSKPPRSHGIPYDLHLHLHSLTL